MDIEQIKKWLEEELSKGNAESYKKLLSYCMKLYKFENKDKVALHNSSYYDKSRVTLNNKKDNDGLRVNLKKDTIKDKKVRVNLKGNPEKEEEDLRVTLKDNSKSTYKGGENMKETDKDIEELHKETKEIDKNTMETDKNSFLSPFTG